MCHVLFAGLSLCKSWSVLFLWRLVISVLLLWSLTVIKSFFFPLRTVSENVSHLSHSDRLFWWFFCPFFSTSVGRSCSFPHVSFKIFFISQRLSSWFHLLDIFLNKTKKRTQWKHYHRQILLILLLFQHLDVTFYRLPVSALNSCCTGGGSLHASLSQRLFLLVYPSPYRSAEIWTHRKALFLQLQHTAAGGCMEIDSFGPSVLKWSMSSTDVSFWELHCWGSLCPGGVVCGWRLFHTQFGQTGTVSPASYKSSKSLMLQTTFVSVSKEKKEIHCGALAWI